MALARTARAGDRRGRPVLRRRPLQGRQRQPRPRRRRRPAEGRWPTGWPTASARATPWPASAATSSSLLCSDLTSPRDAVVLSERIQAAVREPITAGDTELVVTLSIGIAYDERGISQPDALRARRRRGHVPGQVARAGPGRGLRRRPAAPGPGPPGHRVRPAPGHRRRASSSCTTSRSSTCGTTGCPASRRSCAGTTPSRGLLAPAEFMAVAEETGLIVPLGRHLFAEACQPDRGLAGGPGRRRT